MACQCGCKQGRDEAAAAKSPQGCGCGGGGCGCGARGPKHPIAPNGRPNLGLRAAASEDEGEQ